MLRNQDLLLELALVGNLTQEQAKIVKQRFVEIVYECAYFGQELEIGRLGAFTFEVLPGKRGENPRVDYKFTPRRGLGLAAEIGLEDRARIRSQVLAERVHAGESLDNDVVMDIVAERQRFERLRGNDSIFTIFKHRLLERKEPLIERKKR